MSRSIHTFEFEVECCGATVDGYVCEFTVSPGEAPSGPSYDCAGTPGEPPGIEDKEVYFLRVEPCPEHRFKFAGRDSCRECRKVKEPRPEMVDLVDDDELLRAAGYDAECAYLDAAEARWEARHDR